MQVTAPGAPLIYDFIEKLMEYDIHCVPCSYTNEVIALLP